MPYITLNSGEPGIRGLLRFRPETGPAPGAHCRAPRRPSLAGGGQAGWMLAFRWNTLPGSYSALIPASRSYLAGP